MKFGPFVRLALSILLMTFWTCSAPTGPASAQEAAQPAAPPVASITIPAWAFDRSNAKVFVSQYCDAGPMVAYGGYESTYIEYDIEFPVEAEYTLSFRYTAGGSRPMDLLLDGKPVGKCCGGVTGSWNTSGAKWEETCKLTIGAGKHTIRLTVTGALPHITTLRFDSPVAFPEGCDLSRPNANKLPEPPFSPLYARAAPTPRDAESLRLAIEDLIERFGPQYARGNEFLARLAELEKQIAPLKDNPPTDQRAAELKDAFLALQKEALLANPQIDFTDLLFIQRKASSPELGLPRNWQSNSSLPANGYEDALIRMNLKDGSMQTVFQPNPGRFLGDLELHYDAGRMLFSMRDENNRWQVYQMNTDGTGLTRLTGQQPDVDSYDACYLPDGRIIFTSTAYFVGVPCVYGNSHVAVNYIMDADGSNIRQLCFDQEHNWCPAVLNNGRVLYTRWEYTDTPHSNTRLLFHMNPDGTQQMEYYGSNSYWPNSFFYTRAIPGHPTKVVSVIGGHHDNPRMGELIIFDPAEGRREARGALQRIPGRGQKVEAIIKDGLTLDSWPKFLHPYPLDEKTFIVTCRPGPQSLWGIYLVDVFDNFQLIQELPDFALMEPTPIRVMPKPPIIPDKVDLSKTTATVYIPDIYAGNGLKDIPRGTVKSIRIVTYHFSYQNMGGLLGVIGMDGPWDIKRVVGTVPVYADGSAKFTMPANMPVALQPLDADGKAVQLMRSWMTAMPGEVVACSGCHEPQNTAPPIRQTLAQQGPPSEIQPFFGPLRGFSYAREVQPVIDRYCVGCHNGEPRPDGREIPNLRGDVKLTDWKSITPGNGGGHAGKFSVGYAELHRFVRRPGIESDYHMLEPMEFHADTTQLVQMLKKGHHGVKLDDESWTRLITWIDLNCPFHGTWGEELDRPGPQRDRRRDLLKLYAGIEDDPEAVPETSAEPIEPIVPEQVAVAADGLTCPDWPFDAQEAQRRQAALGPSSHETIDLGDGITLEMVRIPAGRFIMGSDTGYPDERPRAVVAIDRPFWMARLEVTNRMFQQFNPTHDSRVESKNTYQFGIHGYPVNQPEQPVVRVSWNEAMAFCRYLSERTGRRFTLPTEAQWEWACRAGSNTAMSFGTLDDDFSPYANLADAFLTRFATNPYTVDSPLADPPKYDDWIPKDSRFNDGALLSVEPGRYQPNAWGLCDMHGNVAEWTRSAYRPYPYQSDGRDDPTAAGLKAIRGGSWRDRPIRATASYRWGFQPYQHVYNVGFRVVCEDETPQKVAGGRP